MNKKIIIPNLNKPIDRVPTGVGRVVDLSGKASYESHVMPAHGCGCARGGQTVTRRVITRPVGTRVVGTTVTGTTGGVGVVAPVPGVVVPGVILAG